MLRNIGRGSGVFSSVDHVLGFGWFRLWHDVVHAENYWEWVVAEDRIELPTQGFSILCSTD